MWYRLASMTASSDGAGRSMTWPGVGGEGGHRPVASHTPCAPQNADDSASSRSGTGKVSAMLLVGAAAAVATRLGRCGSAAGSRSMPDAAGVAGIGPGTPHGAQCDMGRACIANAGVGCC